VLWVSSSGGIARLDLRQSWVVISSSGRSETLQSSLKVHRRCVPGAPGFAIPLEVNLLGLGRSPATWVCWPAFSSSPTTHDVGLPHRGSPRHAQDAGWWMLSGVGVWVLRLLERDWWFGFRCESFLVFFLPWVSPDPRRGSVPPWVTRAHTGCRQVDALRRWCLGLGLLERDRWFGFRYGSFSVFFFFSF
jgi:hypothetical protein